MVITDPPPVSSPAAQYGYAEIHKPWKTGVLWCCLGVGLFSYLMQVFLYHPRNFLDCPNFLLVLFVHASDSLLPAGHHRFSEPLVSKKRLDNERKIPARAVTYNSLCRKHLDILYCALGRACKLCQTDWVSRIRWNNGFSNFAVHWNCFRIAGLGLW